MTPTPEDIELASRLYRTPWREEVLAPVIAAHCAPLRELAEIGRLYCEQRKAAHEYDTCDCDHAPTLEAHSERYDRAFNALRDAHNAHLAKQEEPKP